MAIGLNELFLPINELSAPPKPCRLRPPDVAVREQGKQFKKQDSAWVGLSFTAKELSVIVYLFPYL